MKCKCKNKCPNVARIPYGNDFILGICYENVAPGGSSEVTFSDITDLEVKLTKLNGSTTLEYVINEDGDLLLTVPASGLSCATYGILMTGTYNDHAWRWRKSSLFRIVEDNDDSSVEFMETFDEDTYWLEDILAATVVDNADNGETLVIVTHGSVTINNDVVTVVADDVSLD